MKCSICKNPVLPSEVPKICDNCNCTFHRECWNENRGCGTPGCSNLPKRTKNENEGWQEETYWGATTKICPMCGETIKINDLVCPYCQEHFETISPITAGELRNNLAKVPQPIKGKSGAVVIFICGLLGFPAPFNLLFGGIWYSQNRSRLLEASPLHNLLAIIGLSVSAFYLIIFFLIGLRRC